MARKAAARSEISPFHVMEVLRAARERAEAGGDVLHLEVGQPSAGAPTAALDAARAALERPEALGYTDAGGLVALRSRIADHYAEAYGASVDPDRITVTVGSSVGFVLAVLAAFDPGDRVAVTEPGYPCYRQILSALGVDPVGVPIGADSRYQPTPELLDTVGHLDGVMLASPSNPTGSVLTPAERDALVDWAAARDVRVVADEIYHGITFDRPAPGFAGATDAGAIIVNSFSKYYCMTGWRLGWLVLPPELVRPVELLGQNLVISPPTLSQLAALAALDASDELDAHVEAYAANRDVVLAGLEQMGCVDVAPAEGAFYAYADVSHLGIDSEELCRRWLAEVGVAVTPGIDFDPRRGHRSVRLCFAGSRAEVAEAMDRLVSWRP